MSGARGDGRLQTAKGEVAILFTNRALADVEKLTGYSVLQLAAAAQGEALGMNTVAQLLAVGMEYARRDAGLPGSRLGLKDAYAVLDELGFLHVANVVVEALAAVLAFGSDTESDTDPPGR